MPTSVTELLWSRHPHLLGVHPPERKVFPVYLILITYTSTALVFTYGI